ncbi:PIN domain-containing protein [Nocardia sp. BMG111209]|uniref:type II toxin-antitoxin system VapC family toxin n=1 Tax=Nocardia sp. BMG111209 TaxID=1160137 RepID=UPI0009DC0799|nr:PIN domain-containing protein [Nocardia sp. BMG111209]
MTRALPRVVVDTCVVVDLLTGIDPIRAERSKYVLDRHSTDYQILLPAITLTEIAGTGDIRGNHLLPEIREARVKAANKWIDASKFLVAELSERLARKAAFLAVQNQLKGPDATVLATAIEWHCTRLYTRDRGILKCDGDFPGLKILEPEDPPLAPPTLFGDGES